MRLPKAVVALGLDSQSYQEVVGSLSCTLNVPNTAQSCIYSRPSSALS